ncbi:MAG: hypothetical protein JSW00_08995 [Thermoplasmata archaeon]|nr:MAG: hypothetical protein JSW00_08995 [Thermoplasmata archaeon]
MNAYLKIDYSRAGLWDLEKMSDEALGAITRAALQSAIAQRLDSDYGTYAAIAWEVQVRDEEPQKEEDEESES